MKSIASTTAPAIQLIDAEADALAELALGVADRLPQVSDLLLHEIERAIVHTRKTIPANVVTMHSTIEFLDEASDTRRSVQLVYPRDADIAAGRISILTPIGAGLIGLCEGQSILWPDREGRQRLLKVVSVAQQPRHA